MSVGVWPDFQNDVATAFEFCIEWDWVVDWYVVMSSIYRAIAVPIDFISINLLASHLAQVSAANVRPKRRPHTLTLYAHLKRPLYASAISAALDTNVKGLLQTVVPKAIVRLVF